jgi:predicted MFS family arabinose efflux permease
MSAPSTTPADADHAAAPVERRGVGRSDGAGLEPAHERRLLFTLAGIQFTHILDFMIVVPLGPQLTAVYGISDARFGLLVSAYTFSAALSGLCASLYVDRFERKRLLLALYALFAGATLLCALAPSYAALMAARVAAGFFGGILTALVNTIVGDAIPFARRGEATGIVMRAFSLSTVAGVPLSLYLATWVGSWRAPFVVIGLLAFALAALAWRSMPRLDAHLQRAEGRGHTEDLRAVLGEANHWRAFAFVGLMMLSGFSVIPYITIYVTSNTGLAWSQVPLIYLVGGATTFFSARWFGRLADRHGKKTVYRLLSLAALLPIVTITLLPQVPLALLLLVTTAFFVLVSGRMIPGMAIVTSAGQPALRGTYMSLAGSVQQAAAGFAALIGGAIIGRAADGRVLHYGWVGLFAAGATLCAVALVAKVRMHGSGGEG